jgi:uncharacterized protein (TIGR02453 family)
MLRAMGAAYFTADLFRFLTELRDHNERDWFNANKARYEQSARDPFLRLIADLAPKLKKISAHFVADASPVGGSMMRIYRDTRFAKDKTPYKTGLAATFWHAKAKEGAMPAFHLRLEPDHSSVGAGIWRPEPGPLKKIRSAIASDTKRWQRITSDQQLGSGCGMMGESLKRPPPGFDANHPCIEDIKRKDFGLSAPLDVKRLTQAAFLDDVVDGMRAATPFLEFVTKSIGLAF